MARQVRAHIEEAERLSVQDALTGLYNRRFLFSGGAKLLDAATRAGQPCACLMLDVDHFKRVNDTFGHLAGDQVLAHLAGLLAGGRAQVRPSRALWGRGVRRAVDRGRPGPRRGTGRTDTAPAGPDAVPGGRRASGGDGQHRRVRSPGAGWNSAKAPWTTCWPGRMRPCTRPRPPAATGSVHENASGGREGMIPCRPLRQRGPSASPLRIGACGFPFRGAGGNDSPRPPGGLLSFPFASTTIGNRP